MDGGNAARKDLNGNGGVWAIVLAAGEGSRLRTLTTTASGVAVPKQFCSLHDGPSLLDETLQRAATVAPEPNICTVVARDHARWWREALEHLPGDNVIVQPENRGTAIGMLLPLIGILERDPDACVVVLPSDHHVVDEAVLGCALKRAVGALGERDSSIVLLGIAPDAPDSELGYIVPARPDMELSAVTEFVEKPLAAEARRLIECGALWNVFVLAARARVLADLVGRSDPALLERMRAAYRAGSNALADLYPQLPHLDFSRHVARGSEPMLTVLRVPPCGWTDLGTVERLQSTLARSATRAAVPPPASRGRGLLSLQRQHAEWQRRSGERLFVGRQIPATP